MENKLNTRKYCVKSIPKREQVDVRRNRVNIPDELLIFKEPECTWDETVTDEEMDAALMRYCKASRDQCRELGIL